MADERVAVAVSGGGYRASAWGLGVLWALVDAGVHGDVSMVSSVSGGSITNAYVAQGPDYRSMSSDEFAARATPFAERLAGKPAAWWSALLLTLSGWLAAWLLIAFERPGLAPLPIAVSLVASIVGAVASGDLVFNRLELWLYIHLLLGLVGVVVWASGVIPVLGAVLLLGTVALARGPVVGWCLGRSLRTLSPGRGNTLGDLNPEPLHVFLATELRAGHHAAFARNFIYCFDLGLGAKPALAVRVAVQASSNLPGAFPTRWVRTAGMDLRGGDHSAKWLALSDGGDYDNMGDQWPVELSRRIKRLRDLDAIARHPPATTVLADWTARVGTFVIVANASGALGYRRVWKGALPLLGELLGLLQVKDVLYDNGNSVRRQRLIEWFNARKPAGTLIHISSSPYTLAEDWSDKGRSRAAMAWLDSHMTKAEWDQQVHMAQDVGTQFWPLGRERTRAVVRTAYAQTMVNLHLKLGTGFHELPEL